MKGSFFLYSMDISMHHLILTSLTDTGRKGRNKPVAGNAQSEEAEGGGGKEEHNSGQAQSYVFLR
jgi:hypothetical protein